jgi:hypothetical protein
VSPGVERRAKEREYVKKVIAGKPLPIPCDPFKDLPTPSHHIEQGIVFPTRIGEGIEPLRQAKPAALCIRGEPIEDLGLGAGLSSALLTEVHPVPEVQPLVLGRMQEASNQMVPRIQETQRPAAKTPDRRNTVASRSERDRVLSEHASHCGAMIHVLITCGPDGRAAGKAGLILVGCAEAWTSCTLREVSSRFPGRR